MEEANPPVQNGAVGISIRNGPVDAMDVDGPQLNGISGNKRKGRNSTGNGISYEGPSDEEDDDFPLVWTLKVRLERRGLIDLRTKNAVSLKSKWKMIPMTRR